MNKYKIYNMIIVKKSGYLHYKSIRFKCALGKTGIKKNKLEGDKSTPFGTFNILKVYYRDDKIKKIKTNLKKIKIKKNMGWCDDSTSRFYNKQIKLPNKSKHEKLFRNDNLYNVILVLDYNISPTIKNKGSAIFLHVAKNNFAPTNGCVALKQNDLLFLLSLINKNTKIKISNN
jgi:L,D-peptidoglycan transpeptidase YkuD (ErfK/YbiS/YcfS/YnhG family)